MKPIERIAMYLKFRNISPHAFEKKIHLSNGYFSKQHRTLGSVGSDILIKIHEQYNDLNILWVLIGEGQMIKEEMMADPADESHLNQFSSKYMMENGKLKILEEDLEKMQYVIKDKEKIISLYEFMLNNNILSATIADTATTA